MISFKEDAFLELYCLFTDHYTLVQAIKSRQKEKMSKRENTLEAFAKLCLTLHKAAEYSVYMVSKCFVLKNTQNLQMQCNELPYTCHLDASICCIIFIFFLSLNVSLF